METLGTLQDVAVSQGTDQKIIQALEEAIEIIGLEEGVLEREILKVCDTAPGDVQQATMHILRAGGKRIRPALCLLAYRAAGGSGTVPYQLAASCELIHTATLLHDDVIDDADTRRGRPAARVIYGNSVSVLGGDFLLVRAMERVGRHGVEQTNLLVETLDSLVAGEVVQLKRRGSVHTTEDDYYRIIEGKTASLFRFAALSGAIAGGGSSSQRKRLAQFGHHVGLAFQIMDDVLDFTADSGDLGKNLFTDITEGKMTLPLILAAERTERMRPLLEDLLDNQEDAGLPLEIATLVCETEAHDDARQAATKQTELALSALDADGVLEPRAAGVLRELAVGLLDRAM